jgi:hypothetical protein
LSFVHLHSIAVIPPILSLIGFGAAVLVAVVIAISAFQYTRRYVSRDAQKGDRAREALSTWAAARGLAFDERWLRVEGTIGELDVFVSAAYDQLEPGIPPVVTMSSVARVPRDVRIQIAPGRWSLSERIARERISLGDAAFDSALRTWTDNAAECRRMLDDNMRAGLIALSPRQFLYDRGVVEICWDEDYLDDSNDPAARLDAAYSVLEAACPPNS